MTERDVAFVVQGLFEKSDSIGYDCIFQYNLLRSAVPDGATIRVFAERWNSDLYPGIDIRPVSELFEHCLDNPETLVVYHFCDGWPEVEDFLLDWPGRVIVRWHNNTPPWFYLRYSPQYCDRTVGGFEAVLRLLQNPRIRFVTNSEFTTEQLMALGCGPRRCNVVYPASRFLEPEASVSPRSEVRRTESQPQPVQVLFVGRVVPHKGHKHVLAASALARGVLGREVVVNFVGREDITLGSYAEELRNDAERLGVTLRLHGEVAQEELIELYRRTDVFVCLSEHEGFGMPVFEAMRFGVPVVAWAATALRELLQNHPLSPPEFRLSRFAACIVAALRTGPRHAALTAQEGVLAWYTRDVVGRQLEAAVGAWASPVSLEGSGPVAAGRAARARATSEVEDELTRIEAEILRDGAEPLSTEATFDAPYNLVSRYDLDTYRFLSDRLTDLRFRGSAAESEDGSGLKHTLIAAGEFQTNVGRRREAAITIKGAVPRDQHLIFGPYIHFPVGRFLVRFRFTLKLLQEQTIEFRFEAASTRHGLLGSRTGSFPASPNEQEFLLSFENDKQSDVLELRMASTSAFQGELTFLGAEVQRAPLLSELAAIVAVPAEEPVSSAEPPTAPGPALRRLFGRSRPERKEIPAAARELFRRADSLRDNENWLEAANYYREGLKLAPDQSGYLVQLGNMLKEGGAFAESERTYRAALKQDPRNRDTFLQLGDLLRRVGRLAEAEQAFFSAAYGEAAAISAYNELVDLGADTRRVLSGINGR